MQAADLEGCPEGFREEYAKLQKKFLAGLSDRWNLIEANGRSEALNGNRDALVLCLHSLVGAAAAFGFEELSLAARGAEQMTRSANEQTLRDSLEGLRFQIFQTFSVNELPC